MSHTKPGSEETKRIILFNGPPGSGKDTAASIIAKHLPGLVYQYKMALPLKEACHKLLGLQGTLEELEPLKEQQVRFPLIQEGKTMRLRDFYIQLSEDVMKPLFGKKVFGQLAVEYLRQCHEAVATVSDSGFIDEAMPIIDYFGAEHVLLVRLHREGKSFAGDSRSYVELPVQTLDIQNNQDIEEFEKCLWRKVHKHFLVGMF